MTCPDNLQGAKTQPPRSGVRPAEPSLVGQIIDGKYEVLGTLGQGGMAIVYEARDLVLQRRTAIKIAVEGHGYSLKREAQALAAIRHPGFATVYHVGLHGDAEYLAMERIFGETLAARLDELAQAGAVMPIGDVLDILIAVADALSAAHRAGVAQRDLKPANIILAGERTVLVDFGLFIPEVLVSPENEVSGTPEYLAPEVLLRSVERGEGPLIDLYSLGVLAFELLTCSTPFADQDEGRVLAKHVAAEVPDVSTRREVPRELAALVTELLSKDPHDRPPSAEAVVWQLKHLRDRDLRVRNEMSVVAIDDDAGVGRALKYSLESAFPGVRVRPTSRFRDAALDPKPDVVLVDLRMPEVNGLEVCMELLALPEERRPVVVAMSADAREEDLAVLRSVGVRHFVTKDRHFVRAMSDLIARVRNGDSDGPSSLRPSRSL